MSFLLESCQHDKSSSGNGDLTETKPPKLSGARGSGWGEVGGQKAAGQDRRTKRKTYHFCSQY